MNLSDMSRDQLIAKQRDLRDRLRNENRMTYAAATKLFHESLAVTRYLNQFHPDWNKPANAST